MVVIAADTALILASSVAETLAILVAIVALKVVMRLPKAEETFAHYMNIIWEAPERGEAMKPVAGIPSTKIGNAGPDHYFHTIVYCELAKKKEKRKVRMITVGNKSKGKRCSQDVYDTLSEATRQSTGRYLRKR